MQSLEHLQREIQRLIAFLTKAFQARGILDRPFKHLSCLMPYAQIFYDDNDKKKVLLEIGELLSERAIAFWYIDDGAAKWKDKVKALSFCTDS